MEHNYEEINENVRIRPLSEADLERLRTWRNQPDNTLYLRKIPYITKEMQLDWYHRYLENENEITFAIIEILQLNRVVGSLSLYNFDNNKAEFGKILIGDLEARGKKVGTNAVRAVLSIAFERIMLEEVYLYVVADNVAAMRVYERVGFQIVEAREGNVGLEYIMSIKKEHYVRRYQNGENE